MNDKEGGLRIGMFRQVLELSKREPSLFPDSFDQDGVLQQIEDYLEKVDQGTATDEDEYRLHIRLNSENREIKVKQRGNED